MITSIVALLVLPRLVNLKYSVFGRNLPLQAEETSHPVFSRLQHAILGLDTQLDVGTWIGEQKQDIP
jgi:hypothetical protein